MAVCVCVYLCDSRDHVLEILAWNRWKKEIKKQRKKEGNKEYIICVCTKSFQSRLTLYPEVCSPPGSSVHRILQARILDWVAISFSRGSSRPRDWNWVSCDSCIAGGFFTNEPQRKSVGPNINISNCYCRKLGFIMSDAGKYQRTLDKEIAIHNLHFYQCALTAILGKHCQEQR